MQTSIFEFLYPNFKINKPLRLIELFAGYGSQALALKYLGKEFEHHRICEWAVKSIQAYNDMHIRDYTDYSANYSVDYLRGFLADKGISANYNEPMSRKAVDRLSEKQVRTIYNNIIATHNLVNIQQVHGADLDISGDYIYMMTYSFPCQDLSLAGKTAGMSKGTGTRSGMLWEVERILKECTRLPDILVMENVPQVHSTDNISDFNEWQLCLESLGYNNYCQDLSATDYGIPQTRNRCFMVSLLGGWNYTFPEPETLKIRLKDLLETNVDEKYFLSDKMIQCFMSDGTGNYPRRKRFLQNILRENQDVGNSVTTLAGNRATDNFVFVDAYNGIVREDVAGTITTRVSDSNNTYILGHYSPSGHNAASVVDPNGSAPTVMENHGTVTAIPIKNATTQGYLLAEEGDGVDISSRMQYHRGTVQKGKSQTLTTKADNVGVVMPGLRIRKLTPRECFRLMGVRDEDFDHVAVNQSNASLYHLAGDSIVVNVLMAIFENLF